jgi:pilus assembly protein CpaF
MALNNDFTKNPQSSKVDMYQSIKSRIHRSLLERLDFTSIDTIPTEVLRKEVGRVVEALILEEKIPLSQKEKESLIVDIQHETFGLGPLEVLLSDPDISDILVNRYNQVYIEKHGKLHKYDVMFRDDNHLMRIIERIVSKVGRRIDESSPYVDARLPDGSRVNAIIPPGARRPCPSIRRFGLIPEDDRYWHSVL